MAVEAKVKTRSNHRTHVSSSRQRNLPPLMGSDNRCRAALSCRSNAPMRFPVPIVLLILCMEAPAQALSPTQAEMLAEHNRERSRWGVPALRWSPALATLAGRHAEQLARTGQWRHSDRLSGDEGENLWMGTRGRFVPSQMIGAWLQQRTSFVPGRFPRVSRSGNWADVGHYSQVVWRGTTHVGCAIRSSASSDYLVCRYGPAGNVLGEGVF